MQLVQKCWLHAFRKNLFMVFKQKKSAILETACQGGFAVVQALPVEHGGRFSFNTAAGFSTFEKRMKNLF